MRTVVVLVCAVGLVGCSSTREKADKFAAGGSEAFKVKGLSVKTANKSVTVKTTQVIRDANGTAAVVVLRNDGATALQDVPLALDVADAAGKSIWKNDAPGLDASLVSVPVLPSGRDTLWINDQVLPATGTAAKATVRVGTAKPAPGLLPELTVVQPKLEGDPVDGVVARGQLTNSSRVDQKELVVSGLARKGEAIVAAGRGIIPLVKAGAKVGYAIFFIGDPRGAALEVTAAPTTLEGAG